MSDNNTDESFFPILENSNSIRKLSSIALELGAERTCTEFELMPFLTG